MTEIETKKNAGENLLDLPKPPRTNERWTLLLVGASGKITQIRRVRGWLTLLIALPVLVLALAAGVYLRSDSRTVRERRPTDEIDRLQAEVRRLTDENVRLAARFAAKNKEEVPVRPAPQALQAEPPTAPLEEAVPTRSKDSSPSAAEQTPAAAIDAGSELVDATPAFPDSALHQSQSVEVKDLVVNLDQNLGTVRVRFKIVNRLSDGGTFSGYAFVILKSGAQKPQQWLSFPEAALESGEPVSFKNGYDFNISNFMFIRFKPRRLGAGDSFQMATVLVYSTTGQLLLSTDFQLGTRRE